MNDYFERLTAQLNQNLLRGIDPEGSTLEAAMYYALTLKGKRLRPLLFLSLLDAYGRDPMPHLDVAAALEIIHTYSLIHDDLPSMDNDDCRRGQPTVHKQFNEAVALLTGDTLLTMAFEKIARASLPPPIIVAIISLITDCIGQRGMALGQILDLEFAGCRDDIAVIHRLKTAELIKGCLLAAALIAERPEGQQDLLAQAALSLGIGFQLADDLLDLTGDESQVGKKLGKDQGNRSPNAALYYDLAEVKKQIDAHYRRALEMVDQLGIRFPPFLQLLQRMVYRDH